MLLDGKIALVTGAFRGIGFAIAEELARLGAKVAACDINADCVSESNDFFKKNNLEGTGFVMDVTNKDSIDSAMSEITNKYGMPHILVNNAGVVRDNLVIRMSDEEWSKVIETNLTSVFLLSRRCVRSMMKERWGRIVNIVSVVGITGNAGQTNYTASKAGVIAFSKSLAKEVATRGITVNCIAPGYIETDMTRALSKEHSEILLKMVPLNRAGTTQDVAKAVAFLVSDGASYITGETLNVNGGMFMP